MMNTIACLAPTTSHQLTTNNTIRRGVVASFQYSHAPTISY